MYYCLPTARCCFRISLGVLNPIALKRAGFFCCTQLDDPYRDTTVYCVLYGVVARALEEIAGVDCCSKSGIVCCLGMTGNAATVMLCARVCPTLHAPDHKRVRTRRQRSRCVGPGRSNSGGRPNDGGLFVVFCHQALPQYSAQLSLVEKVLCSHCTSENLNVLLIAPTILCSRCCTLFDLLLIVGNCFVLWFDGSLMFWLLLQALSD